MSDDVKNILGVDVTFSTKTFKIVPLPIKRSREWRESFTEQIDGILGLVDNLQGISLGDIGSSSSFESLMPLMNSIKDYLQNSTDILLELIYDFAPTIKKEKDWIENHATDPEVFTVFLEVLKMAYPFGQVLSRLTTLGSDPQLTSTNSQEPSGESGATN